MSSKSVSWRLFVCVVLAGCLLTLGVPGESRAGDDRLGVGSHVVPSFRIEPEGVDPGASATLLACVSQTNRNARRELQSGDSFGLEFGAGVVGACGDLSVSGLGGTDFEAHEWSCTVSGAQVLLEYLGATRHWPFGATTCVTLPFVAPDASVPIATSFRVGNSGAYHPAEPTLLVLGVAPDIGQPGPTGPVGPEGPRGERGESAVGSTLLLRSTGAASAIHGAPPELIPGLEGTIDVEAGSELAVFVDTSAHARCWDPARDPWRLEDGRLQVELDGHVVVRRRMSYEGAVSDSGRSSVITWRSGPLAGGLHTLRVLIAEGDAGPGLRRTGCYGDVHDSQFEARVLLMELKR